MDADIAVLAPAAVAERKMRRGEATALESCKCAPPKKKTLATFWPLGNLPLSIRVESNTVNGPEVAFDSSKLFLDGQMEEPRTTKGL